jgi:hypothetical protein
MRYDELPNDTVNIVAENAKDRAYLTASWKDHVKKYFHIRITPVSAYFDGVGKQIIELRVRNV